MLAYALKVFFTFLGVLLLRILFVIFFRNGFIPEKRSRRQPARTLIVLGSGGHTTEMLQVVAGMKSDRYSPRIYVRASTDAISADKVRTIEGEANDYKLLDIRRSREVHQPYLASVWTTIVATMDSVPLLWKQRPDLILCNESISMDVGISAEDLLPSQFLLDDIKTNSPSELKAHLTKISQELWIYITSKKVPTYDWLQTRIIVLEACLDRTWESLNSGNWKDVSINYRYCYSFCTILKSVLLLLRLENDKAKEKPEFSKVETLEDIILQIDKGILLGAPPLSEPNLLPKIARKLSSIIIEMKGKKCWKTGSAKRLGSSSVENQPLPGFDPIVRRQKPSMESFYTDIFQSKTPTVLEGCMEHWKALDLWSDPKYLLRTAGIRTVPIEIGSRYTEEDWTQRLVSFSEFLESYVMSDREPSELGYLAQHGLFDQIPELMDDISVPDYCSFSYTGEEATPPVINAWLGPARTVSPLHFDPKNNLLCQVFGTKRVILYHPSQTPNLYPYETRLLSNTARVDPMNKNFEDWPKFKQATGTTCILAPGEMLFIPPGWWHHVVSLSPSFSVSFWWD